MNEIDFMGILPITTAIGLIAVVVDVLVNEKCRREEHRCREEGEEPKAGIRFLEGVCPIVVPLAASLACAIAIFAGAQFAEDTVVPILRSIL